ncbi:hypothetical protein PHYBLDRAFT_166025 [Phycomyces blakesleeanus NRRL 1555(-)]|uniref:Uncharacterized protein n=1 Tax=Phycomyces blakesleeanus (strain ATCC 8743b / DSM 1359 / FGSC 10004 / NBRC 33097 / NRRL 1555) TaxID=763407 RepID=A0A167NJ34_PHYB8|nr:hypothetical protein PHYBLDRAFT_166025 [Phycomyces blakesleeanus NRRL 1555(-)]OAD76049.1 hypothetical protein PHYBLDRAFT_166025 [Phycomyces blakesleeanus NRRL 1555(-)]|eukprot:XP_018294089.1 hypothetical protein PHYBLDRAFT_166025 [Phycomyces blakesleeanus NRRL 1555(-)]
MKLRICSTGKSSLPPIILESVPVSFNFSLLIRSFRSFQTPILQGQRFYLAELINCDYLSGSWCLSLILQDKMVCPEKKHASYPDDYELLSLKCDAIFLDILLYISLLTRIMSLSFFHLLYPCFQCLKLSTYIKIPDPNIRRYNKKQLVLFKCL